MEIDIYINQGQRQDQDDPQPIAGWPPADEPLAAPASLEIQFFNATTIPDPNNPSTTDSQGNVTYNYIDDPLFETPTLDDINKTFTLDKSNYYYRHQTEITKFHKNSYALSPQILSSAYGPDAQNRYTKNVGSEDEPKIISAREPLKPIIVNVPGTEGYNSQLPTIKDIDAYLRRDGVGVNTPIFHIELIKDKIPTNQYQYKTNSVLKGFNLDVKKGEQISDAQDVLNLPHYYFKYYMYFKKYSGCSQKKSQSVLTYVFQNIWESQLHLSIEEIESASHYVAQMPGFGHVPDGSGGYLYDGVTSPPSTDSIEGIFWNKFDTYLCKDRPVAAAGSNAWQAGSFVPKRYKITKTLDYNAAAYTKPILQFSSGSTLKVKAYMFPRNWLYYGRFYSPGAIEEIGEGLKDISFTWTNNSMLNLDSVIGSFLYPAVVRDPITNYTDIFCLWSRPPHDYILPSRDNDDSRNNPLRTDNYGSNWLSYFSNYIRTTGMDLANIWDTSLPPVPQILTNFLSANQGAISVANIPPFYNQSTDYPHAAQNRWLPLYWGYEPVTSGVDYESTWPPFILVNRGQTKPRIITWLTPINPLHDFYEQDNDYVHGILGGTGKDARGEYNRAFYGSLSLWMKYLTEWIGGGEFKVVSSFGWARGGMRGLFLYNLCPFINATTDPMQQANYQTFALQNKTGLRDLYETPLNNFVSARGAFVHTLHHVTSDGCVVHNYTRPWINLGTQLIIVNSASSSAVTTNSEPTTLNRNCNQSYFQSYGMIYTPPDGGVWKYDTALPPIVCGREFPDPNPFMLYSSMGYDQSGFGQPPISFWPMTPKYAYNGNLYVQTEVDKFLKLWNKFYNSQLVQNKIGSLNSGTYPSDNVPYVAGVAGAKGEVKDQSGNVTAGGTLVAILLVNGSPFYVWRVVDEEQNNPAQPDVNYANYYPQDGSPVPYPNPLLPTIPGSLMGPRYPPPVPSGGGFQGELTHVDNYPALWSCGEIYNSLTNTGNLYTAYTDMLAGINNGGWPTSFQPGQIPGLERLITQIVYQDAAWPDGTEERFFNQVPPWPGDVWTAPWDETYTLDICGAPETLELMVQTATRIDAITQARNALAIKQIALAQAQLNRIIDAAGIANISTLLRAAVSFYQTITQAYLDQASAVLLSITAGANVSSGSLAKAQVEQTPIEATNATAELTALQDLIILSTSQLITIQALTPTNTEQTATQNGFIAEISTLQRWVSAEIDKVTPVKNSAVNVQNSPQTGISATLISIGFISDQIPIIKSLTELIITLLSTYFTSILSEILALSSLIAAAETSGDTAIVNAANSDVVTAQATLIAAITAIQPNSSESSDYTPFPIIVKGCPAADIINPIFNNIQPTIANHTIYTLEMPVYMMTYREKALFDTGPGASRWANSLMINYSTGAGIPQNFFGGYAFSDDSQTLTGIGGLTDEEYKQAFFYAGISQLSALRVAGTTTGGLFTVAAANRDKDYCPPPDLWPQPSSGLNEFEDWIGGGKCRRDVGIFDNEGNFYFPNANADLMTTDVYKKPTGDFSPNGADGSKYFTQVTSPHDITHTTGYLVPVDFPPIIPGFVGEKGGIYPTWNPILWRGGWVGGTTSYKINEIVFHKPSGGSYGYWKCIQAYTTGSYEPGTTGGASYWASISRPDDV